jgi:hypothetical protein
MPNEIAGLSTQAGYESPVGKLILSYVRFADGDVM